MAPTMEVEFAMPVHPQKQAIPLLTSVLAPAPIKGTFHIPPSNLTAQIHPLHEGIIAEVDAFFLQHWPFPNDKERNKFLKSAFSQATCLTFPKALDDRIHFACRLLTLLFLVDGKQ